MKRLIGIIQFMTRIPIPVDTGFDEEFHKGIIYFPIVGVILGICYYIIGALGLQVFNSYIATIMILIGEVILTGGLHLDGLGDTFDGLYSYRDKDRILEIMKDSRLGTNGLLAIMLVLMLKAGLLYDFIDRGNLWIVIIMPTVARTMQVFACYQTKTPREKGMGNIFIGKVEAKTLIGAYLLLGLAILGTIGIVGGLNLIFWALGNIILVFGGSIILLTLINKLFIKSVYKKIDGITGDILGCICELAELEFLILISLLGQYMCF